MSDSRRSVWPAIQKAAPTAARAIARTRGATTDFIDVSPRATKSRNHETLLYVTDFVFSCFRGQNDHGNFLKYGTVSCSSSATVQNPLAMNAYGANFGCSVL